MSNTFTKSMFQSIKETLAQEETSQSGFRDILRFTPGNTYTVRLIPNIKDVKQTFYHYFQHGWESYATGQYISALSPQTFGERDPIAEERFRIWRTGSPEEKKRMEVVRRNENWLVNVYVVDDPTSPENNNEIKILRYGKQLHKIITEAIGGDDADEFGDRIFDFTNKGCNLKIKCEKQGDWVTYVSSRFTTPTEIKSLSKEDIQEVYDNIHDLTTIFPVKSYDELKQMLDEHYFCKETSSIEPSPETQKEEEDDIPYDDSPTDSSDNTDDPLEDDAVKELLEGLDE